MKHTDFEKDRVAKLLGNSPMYAVFDSLMKTRASIDFTDFFDFSFNKKICFSSDYGGENDQSKYNVYTFTFHSFSSLQNWKNKLDKIRSEKGYEKTAEYKKIKPKTREGKLKDWLETSKDEFKGIIVSFAVDKNIESLFASSCDELLTQIKAQPHLNDCNLSAKVLEKAFRISNFSGLVLSQLLQDDGGYWWMTDRDSIAQGEDRWNFTAKLHRQTLNHYCEHLTKVKTGYSTPFSNEDEEDYFSDDFLSLSDLISGAIDDYTNHYQGKTPAELLNDLKPKTIEILSYLNKLPTFIYVLESNGTGTQCKRVKIEVNENKEK